jgi:hypothetical protein
MDDKPNDEVAHGQQKMHVNGHEYDPDDPEDDVYADDAFLTSKADSTLPRFVPTAMTTLSSTFTQRTVPVELWVRTLALRCQERSR